MFTQGPVLVHGFLDLGVIQHALREIGFRGIGGFLQLIQAALIDEWLQGVQFCFDDELMLFVALLSQAGDVLLLVDDGQLLVVALDARLQGFHLRVQGARL